MDQSRYWIQNEGTNCFNSHVLSSFGDSWEEQAFAEDAAGLLGSCIWPPRSYTCSFCRREFRSAQALGGHMNVHRRDRVRLKQISSPKNNQVVEPTTSNLNRCVLQNPNEICNPNFYLDHPLFSSSSTRPNMVSIIRPFTCSFGQEQQKSKTSNTPILSWSKFEPRKRFHIDDLGNQQKDDAAQVLESNSATSKKDNHHTEVCFTSNLNSLVRKRYEITMFHENDDAHDGLIFKKRRIDDDNDVQSFFPKSDYLVISDETESVVPLKFSPNSTLENLDLELRLGDRP